MANLIITAIIIAATAGATGMLLALLLYLRITKKHPRRGTYDIEYCCSDANLRRVVDYINTCGYKLISVAQHEDKYTVFFWRPKDG